MNILFFAYANSQAEPLATLTEEDAEVYRKLVGRSTQQHYALHRDSHATIKSIAEYLILFRDQLAVFHFSGHAGRDRLLLGDQAAGAHGIAGLLGQCPRLKLIVLNGCSTHGQVATLNALPNHPAVIATSSPVNDRSATQFAISFYQALSEQHAPLEDAFTAGRNAASIQRNAEILVEQARDAHFEGTDANDGLWGLYADRPESLQYRLPSTPYVREWVDYKPNHFLIDKLMEALQEYVPEVKKIVEAEEMGLEKSMVEKRKAILTPLPHPVSEQLRKLLVPEVSNDGNVYYDRLGRPRLEQIILTYMTMQELAAYILLTQIWDLVHAKTLQLQPEELEQLKMLFRQRDPGQELFEYIPFIRFMRELLSRNNLTPFIAELSDVAKAYYAEGDFYNASIFLDSTRKRLANRDSGLSEDEVYRLCMLAEEKLARYLEHFGFIVRYRFTSIKSIDVIKYRHQSSPYFKHRMVKLVQSFVGLAEDQELRDSFLDSSSILIERKDESGESEYLNLSPFIIDENAFVPKSGISKLYVFDRYLPGSDVYQYRHVYKPSDEPLVISDQRNLKIIKKQFEAFAKDVFAGKLAEAVG